jgi:hypothetical protein
MNVGGGEINEMCESKHTMPSEMRGGGEPKGDHCFSKKILNPIRLKFERKTFRMTFCKFLPNPSNWRFFVRIFSGKSGFLPPVRFQNRITSKNSTRTFLKCMPK